MGMFDNIEVKHTAAVKFNIPIGVYQTKQFNLALDLYEIREDGKIMLKGKPHEQWWTTNIPDENGIMCGVTGSITMCRDDKDNPFTVDYTVNVVNGYVTHITETAKTADDFDLDYIDIDLVNWEYE